MHPVKSSNRNSSGVEPALTAVLAVILLRERLELWQWMGAGLILCALILVQGDVTEMPAQTETVVRRGEGRLAVPTEESSPGD